MPGSRCWVDEQCSGGQADAERESASAIAMLGVLVLALGVGAYVVPDLIWRPSSIAKSAPRPAQRMILAINQG